METKTKTERIVEMSEQGYNNTQIADALGISKDVVKSIKYRASKQVNNKQESKQVNNKQESKQVNDDQEQRLDALENQVQAINNGMQEIKTMLSALMQNNAPQNETPTQEKDSLPINDAPQGENEEAEKEALAEFFAEDDGIQENDAPIDDAPQTGTPQAQEEEPPQEESAVQIDEETPQEATPQTVTAQGKDDAPKPKEKPAHIPYNVVKTERKKEKLDKLLSEYGLIEPQARYLKDKAEWDEEIKREVAKKQEEIKPPTVAEEKEGWQEFFATVDINTGKPFNEIKEEKGTQYFLNPDVYEQHANTRGLAKNTLEYASWLVDNVDGKQALCKGLQGIIRIQPKYNIYCKNLSVENKTKQRVTFLYNQMRKVYTDLMDYLEYDAPYYTTHFYYTPKDSEDDFFFGYVDYGNALDAYNIPEDVKTKIKNFVNEYREEYKARITAIQAAKEAQEEAERQARKQQREAEAQAVREQINNSTSAA